MATSQFNRWQSFLLLALFLFSLIAAFLTGFFSKDIVSPGSSDLAIAEQALGILLNHSFYEVPDVKALE
jgi:hypothetical protein